MFPHGGRLRNLDSSLAHRTPMLVEVHYALVKAKLSALRAKTPKLVVIPIVQQGRQLGQNGDAVFLRRCAELVGVEQEAKVGAHVERVLLVELIVHVINHSSEAARRCVIAQAGTPRVVYSGLKRLAGRAGVSLR